MPGNDCLKGEEIVFSDSYINDLQLQSGVFDTPEDETEEESEEEKYL